MTINVSTSAALRSAIQTVSSSDPTIQLDGTGTYSTVVTLGKQSSSSPAAVAYSGYTVQGSSATLASSATLQDTRIYQQNVDGPHMPGTVQNLTLNYNKLSGASSNGGALLSVTSTAARSLTVNNVAFTGTHSGWNGNGGLYMSLRSFNAASPLNTTLTLNNVNVAITGQNNGFDGTTGGSSFLHNWNNNGVVTISGSTFDEAGFRSSFQFVNFNAPSSSTAAPVHIISNNIFKRTSNQTVRSEGNILSNVNATLAGNTFENGSFLDLGANVAGLTFNGNTFNTIAGGCGIRVNGTSLAGSPTFSPTLTNTFTGPGLALKYVSNTASTGAAFHGLNYVGSFSVGGKTFGRMVAFGQGNDAYNVALFSPSVSAWISGDDGNDSLSGSNQDDCILGGIGNDSLNGNGGLDTIEGGTGDDTLNGATGNDVLTGGTGVDVFRWAAATGTISLGITQDKITDFSSADGDRMALSDIFANTLPNATLNSLDFQTIASLTGTSPLAAKVTKVTSGVNNLSTFVTSSATGAGYVLCFDTSTSRATLVYDTNWADTANRQICYTLETITTQAAFDSATLTSSQFMAY